MNVDITWSKVLEELKNKLTSLSFRTWFEETELYKLHNGKAYILVPLPMHKTHLKTHYYDLVHSIIYEITNTDYDLIFMLKDEIENDDNLLFNDGENTNEIVIHKENKEESREKHQSNLNPNYTFDNFIVGNSNKFAQAAALSVAENPGRIYNPLFLYGNSGVGKTHLMQAIGNYVENNSNKNVLYVTSEQFVDDFVKASRKDENGTNFNYIDFFKNKYRNIDVLIIDDIQYLGGAQKSQEGFFHTFNNLFNDSKQIIVSSDRSPDDLKQLEERLRTRFSWGLGVNISPPDYNLKRDILQKKIIANDFEKDIPDDVIDYMASNIGPDVRHLEGAITRLIAYSTIMGGEKITVELAIEALKDYNHKGFVEKNDVHRIQKIVAENFQISVEDIRSKKRSANIAFPRLIAIYLCRMMTSESFPKIGIEFGGKDHSTIMYSCEKIEKEMRENKDLANEIEKLKKQIGNV